MRITFKLGHSTKFKVIFLEVTMDLNHLYLYKYFVKRKSDWQIFGPLSLLSQVTKLLYQNGPLVSYDFIPVEPPLPVLVDLVFLQSLFLPQ